jgi:T5orf172 domain
MGADDRKVTLAGGTPGGRPKRNYKTYFLRADDLIKIGRTSGSVENRLRNLRTGNPTLVLLHVHTQDIEKECHRRFAHLRQQGEFFLASESLLAFIDRLKTSQ